MANIVLTCFSFFYRLTWVQQRWWPRATPDFGSVSVIRSFLLQDIPRHPDIRLFEVREAFKRSLLRGFQAHIRAYIAFFSPPGGPPGALPGQQTDAEPLFNALRILRTFYVAFHAKTMRSKTGDIRNLRASYPLSG